jgi:Subtilase family
MPPLTPHQLATIRSAKLKVSTAASKLAGLTPLLPGVKRNPRGSRPRHLRFVIETKTAAKLADVRKVVGSVLGGTGILAAGVSWAGRRLVVPGGAVPGLKVGAAFDVRFMFPGADPADQRFKLANFVVLTLPVDPLRAKRELGGGKGSLYDLAYSIRDAGNFIRVDPEVPFKGWQTMQAPPPPPPGQTTPPGGSTTGGPHLVAFSFGGSGTQAPIDHAWNHRKINMPAPNTALSNGGAGILVGQVDSGTRNHPECTGIYAPVAQQGSTIDGDDDPVDPLSSFPGDQPGHGIATASVLASRGGVAPFNVGGGAPLGIGTTNPAGGATPPNHEVTGIANQCTVVPVRAVSSVALNVLNINLAEGVWHCIQQSVDVITMSIGGLCHPWLERVISFAVFNNIIVVGAAGQIWPWVTAPAVYDDCIAATASTPLDVVMDEPMRAARGTAVDIGAPGTPIWCADANQSRGNFISASSGTSFAAPTVAGAAALWLVRHGRAALIQQYQNGPKLAEVFRHLIRSTARVPAGWDTAKSGAGIIHVTNLLNAALPAAGAVAGRNWSNYDAASEFDILRVQLGSPNQNAFVAALGRLFNATAAEIAARMQEFGSEILTLLETNAGAFEELKNAVEAEVQAAQDAAQEAVDNVVDAIEDACSDVVGTVMGWFD